MFYFFFGLRDSQVLGLYVFIKRLNDNILSYASFINVLSHVNTGSARAYFKILDI